MRWDLGDPNTCRIGGEMPEIAYADGVPCWVDHLATDPLGAKEFYGGLFEWDFVAAGGRYDLIGHGDGLIGGLGPAPPGPHRAAAWNVYLATRDADVTRTEVRRLGGLVLPEPTSGPGRLAGRLFFAIDPDGAPVGFWEGPREQATVLAGEPGAMCWHELYVRNPTVADGFYGGLFDTLTTGPLYKIGGVPQVGRLRSGGRPHWLPYFGVAHLPTWTPAAIAAGARVVGLSPTRPGTAALVLRDPWDAPFGVIEAPRQSVTE